MAGAAEEYERSIQGNDEQVVFKANGLNRRSGRGAINGININTSWKSDESKGIRPPSLENAPVPKYSSSTYLGDPCRLAIFVAASFNKVHNLLCCPLSASLV